MIFDPHVIRLLHRVLQKRRHMANPRNVKSVQQKSVQHPLTERQEKIKAEVLRQRRAAEERAATREVTNSEWDDEDGWADAGDRSSNDDRSDSTNPNNDAYDAAMDNHANQMNPNNDVYHSSRGR